MTTPDELYAAILADPNDMALRLRYADAIESTDPDHAELIRRQIEPDRLGTAGSQLSLVESARRGRLERSLSDRLGAPVAGLVTDVALRRGFPELIELPGADFLRNGAEICRRIPVRHALLSRVDVALVAELAASPLLGRLTSLSLKDDPIGDEGVRVLLGSPHIAQLRWLGLGNCGIGNDGADLFATMAPRLLPHLRYLDWYGNPSELVCYTEGQDAISGEASSFYVPERAKRVVAEHGPLPWLDLGWKGFVDFGEV